MSVVAVAILISFHLKSEPTSLERRVALPFGLVFWFLALACLISGLSNYIKTVNRYSRRQALVQSGVATQIVSRLFHFVLSEETSLRGGFPGMKRSIVLIHWWRRCSR